MAVQIQLRRGLAADWTATNPVLAEGEVGLELDTGRSKWGDGVAAWNALPYYDPIQPVILRGAAGTHTGDNTRTSVFTSTLPGNSLGPNGALEVAIAARVDSAPVGQWLVEVELDGNVIATAASIGLAARAETLVHNQNDAAVQVAVNGDDVSDLAIDTTADVTIEVFATLTDAGDTGKTITIYSLLARATYGA